ncbi:MAG: hypothetical protein R3C16_00500 [Hyphomonadaceae bacterium]
MIASTLLAGLAAAQPSGGGHGASSSGGHGSSGGEEGEEPAASARSMDAPYLAVPVVRDGQLVNYLFVSIRIEISPNVDLWRTREQAHFLRDALVRASHSNDLADPVNSNLLNESRAIEVYRAAAIHALGERAIAGVSIVSSYSSQGSGV